MKYLQEIFEEENKQLLATSEVIKLTLFVQLYSASLVK
jgi:hypothetical protein